MFTCLSLFSLSAEDLAFILIPRGPRIFCETVYIQRENIKAKLTTPGRS